MRSVKGVIAQYAYRYLIPKETETTMRTYDRLHKSNYWEFIPTCRNLPSCTASNPIRFVPEVIFCGGDAIVVFTSCPQHVTSNNTVVNRIGPSRRNMSNSPDIAHGSLDSSLVRILMSKILTHERLSSQCRVRMEFEIKKHLTGHGYVLNRAMPQCYTGSLTNGMSSS